ncbi:MAG: hypothetical protein AB1Z67_02525 [Candidatus Limnocylindrales bacterium]
MATPHRLAPLPALLAAVFLAATAMPAAATVVFVPTREPAPESWPAEVPVDVEWANVSMLIPEAWTFRIKREPGVETNGASLLAAFGPGKSTCLLDYYEAGTVETWQDVGVSPVAELRIDGHPTERFDDMLGSGAAAASAYAIDAGSRTYALFCTADQAPTDRWLSIAQTITVP